MIKKKLLLVDGTNYLYRTYHAMPELSVIDGELTGTPTGAVKGMYTVLKSLVKRFDYTHNALVFDIGKSKNRTSIFKDYKANRKETPLDLRLQKPYVRKLSQLLGWNVIEVLDEEADDAIGSLARIFSSHGYEVTIISSDKDFCQLVNDNITVIDTLRNKTRNITGVKEEFGIPPELFRDYLSLLGDAVDNIPGVPGVGRKTAVKLLKEHGNLRGVIDNSGTIPGKVGENIRNSLEQIQLARKLVRINTLLEFGFGIEFLKNKPVKIKELEELLMKLNIAI